MTKKNKILTALGLTAALSGLSCDDGGQQQMMMMMPEPTPQTPIAPDFEYMHGDSIFSYIDPTKDGNQVTPEVGERLHSCGKIAYATLGNILVARGVNTANMAADMNHAGTLFQSGKGTLGGPDYPSLSPESDRNTTGGIVRLYDILIAAVEQLVTATNADGVFPSVAMNPNSACAGSQLFTGSQCNATGIGCFIGMKPTAAQINQCNDAVRDTSFGPTELERKRLAVAALAAAIYLCD